MQAYEFHKVYHTLNQFCAVDLSSLYIDITKDRMYCDASDSPRRRATQMAMQRIFDALCPDCSRRSRSFTAEEAWSYLECLEVGSSPIVSRAGHGVAGFRSGGTGRPSC